MFQFLLVLWQNNILKMIVSWGIPYAAGVLAMGWQIAPEKTGEEMAALLIDTAYQQNDMKFIYPEAFIEALLAEQQ